MIIWGLGRGGIGGRTWSPRPKKRVPATMHILKISSGRYAEVAANFAAFHGADVKLVGSYPGDASVCRAPSKLSRD